MPPSPLPIDEVLPELIASLRAGPSAVLIAPTGAGKTTRVPPALLAAASLGGRPTIESRGRLYPVETLHAARPADRSLPGQVAAGVRRLLAATPGDLLAFLPGVGEIQRCAEALRPLAAEQGLAVLP